MDPLTPYLDFLYFVLLLYPTMPAIFLGLSGRLRLWYVLLATAGMIWLQYDNPFGRPLPSSIPGAYPRAGTKVPPPASATLLQHLSTFAHAAPQLIYLLVFTAFELLVMLVFAAIRRRTKSHWPYYIAVGAALFPLFIVKFSPLLHIPIGFASSGGLVPTASQQGLLVPGLVDTIGFVGVSYITFRAVDVLINLQDRLIEAPSVGMYLSFLLFFPTISAGPIDRIRRFSSDWRQPRTRSEYLMDMDAGIYRIAQGFLYKFAIAMWIWNLWLQKAANTPGIGGIISYMYAYTLYLFFDFAGYSAFAIGVSRFFGVHTPDNFNLPFLSRNFKDFWNRWFITLSWWLRDHVYMRFVLGATKRRWFKNKYVTSYIGYLITMGLMGIWHGPQANYIIYGLYQGVMLIASDFLARWNQRRKLLPDNSLTRAASVFVTFNFICFGMLIFSGHLTQVAATETDCLCQGQINTKVWHVYQKDSQLSMTSHPGWLTITTEQGPASDLSSAKNIVLRATDPKASITASVQTTLFGLPYSQLQDYQGSALYLWQDANHWIRMQWQPGNCLIAVQFDPGTWGQSTGITLPNGQPVSSQAFAGDDESSAAQKVGCDPADDPIWLRMTKVGSIYTGYYSVNGRTWTATQSFAFPSLQVNDVGFSANSGGPKDHPVAFGFRDFSLN